VTDKNDNYQYEKFHLSFLDVLFNYTGD